MIIRECIHFIRKKATTKHQLKKMTAAMLKVPVCCHVLTEMDEKFLYNRNNEDVKKITISQK